MGIYQTQSGELVEAVSQTELMQGIRVTADDVGRAHYMQGEAKRPTFKAAKAAILSHLQRDGWDVKPHLKVPHATSPDGELRLWFKAQAVYYTWGSKHKLGGAHSLHTDIRDMTPEEFVKDAESYGRKAGKDLAHF